MTGEPHYHVLVVGAGLSGIAAAVALRRAGITDFAVVERADRVGGTWRDNTYPGCGVDIPAPIYSFSFNPNPGWTRNFVSQPELLAYIEDTVTKFGLTEVIQLSTELLEAAWSDDRRRWLVTTSRGRCTARHVIFAAGLLVEPSIPDIPGLRAFPGEVFHSARWRPDVELAGKRVAVIGTGCSGVQLVPEIQPVVRRLAVFQRTASWVIPRLDFPFPAPVRALFRLLPGAQSVVRRLLGLFLTGLAFTMRNAKRARLLQPVGTLLLRLQVRDPKLRAQLTPDFTIGCKRLLLSNTYLPALSRPNVRLVPHALHAVDGAELIAADGSRVEADVIVFASGFELRHPPIATRIRGRDGTLLSERWKTERPQAYRGTTLPGLPNAYLLLGPNVVMYNSLLALAEAQLRYVIDAIRTTDSRGATALEVRPEAFRAHNADLQRELRSSVYNAGGCANFYLDEHGDNFVTSPWSVSRFRTELSRFDAENYDDLPATGGGSGSDHERGPNV